MSQAVTKGPAKPAPSPALHAANGDDGDDAARRLIAAAGPLLGKDTPQNFAELLFARTAPEDLLRYEPRDLARLAQAAWEFLSERKPDTVKMRFGSPPGGGRLDDVSV